MIRKRESKKPQQERVAISELNNIIADRVSITSLLKTFEATGSYGLGVCSALTFQNEDTFTGVHWTAWEDIKKSAFQGTIGVESEPNGITSFIVTLHRDANVNVEATSTMLPTADFMPNW